MNNQPIHEQQHSKTEVGSKLEISFISLLKKKKKKKVVRLNLLEYKEKLI